MDESPDRTRRAAGATNAEQFDALLTAAEDGVDFDGLRVSTDGETYAFATPEVERSGLDERSFRDLAAQYADYVNNWYVWTLADLSADREAFLRWIEGANERPVPERYAALREGGIARSWGQLRITATLADDGERRYDLRHEADAGRDVADLDRHDDPLDARHLATDDERGRYRPLKTAPTLRRGWVYPDLPSADLVRAVDFFYPATVANWHRERAGDLDVSHWRETAERQTGIYGVVEELPPEAVEWVAEACCVDSQCLKRREWDEDEATPLDAPRGDGEFPCREPCSLVIAAARTWTTLEREEPREYTFELTPSEKEQVEAIVEAVADGRTDEIREADVSEGANRYRARYLRAKRFDDEGNLCGVPTDEDGA
ncbi:DR2241 family protein [Halomarina pelagica]|uniref:DR2241 family protein n=1 Tax=Halomarina pelagica TaxID=2961599 RepID=UPI0020C52050|nr:DR2241 family protein [Halomarina sp. BND7]